MKPYLSFFRINVVKGLQYKVSALAGIFTQLFFGFVFIMIFEAFYANNPNQPIAIHQLIQVLWLQQSFLTLTMMWHRDSTLFDAITTGNIAYELCRPSNLYHFWFASLIGQRISGAVLRIFPIMAVAMLLPEPYKLHLPASIIAFVLFIISLILALILIVAISMIIYISVFHTLSPSGSMLIFLILAEFFSGATIPVPLMPMWLKTITHALPFRYISDLPYRVYVGHIETKEALFSIGIQILWIIIIGSFGQLWMKRTLKKVVILGG